MDRVYLSYADEKDVEDLLSQLQDESLLSMKTSRHTSSRRSFGYSSTDHGWSPLEKNNSSDVLDSGLAERFASLKANRPSSRKKGKGIGLIDKKIEEKNLKVASSKVAGGEKSNAGWSYREGIDNIGDEDDIDTTLAARLRALKESPSPPSSGKSENSSSQRSGISPYSGALSSQSFHDLDFVPSKHSVSSFPSSPSASLLPRSDSRPSPRIMSTSVATSCHCSAPSPLKLLKQLSLKKSPGLLPVNKSPGAVQSAPDVKSKEARKEREGKTLRKSSSRKKSQPDEDLASTVSDMRKMLSSVSDRVGYERSRVSSAEDDDMFGDDFRSFPSMDPGKASLDEARVNREAESIVEWARNSGVLEMRDPDFDDEELDFEEDDDEISDSSSSEKGFRATGQLKSKVKKRFSFF